MLIRDARVWHICKTARVSTLVSCAKACIQRGHAAAGAGGHSGALLRLKQRAAVRRSGSTLSSGAAPPASDLSVRWAACMCPRLCPSLHAHAHEPAAGQEALGQVDEQPASALTVLPILRSYRRGSAAPVAAASQRQRPAQQRDAAPAHPSDPAAQVPPRTMQWACTVTAAWLRV
jgi:hypothetical protein